MEFQNAPVPFSSSAAMLSEIFDTSPRLVPAMSSFSDKASPKSSCVAYLERVPLLNDLKEFYARAKDGITASSRMVLADDSGQLLEFSVEGGMCLHQLAYSVDVSFRWTSRMRPFEQYLIGTFDIPTSILADASFCENHLTPALIRDALVLSITRGCIYHLTVSVPPPKDKRTKSFGGKQIPVAHRVVFLSRKRLGDETPRQRDIERIVLAAQVKYCRDCEEWIPFEVVRAQCAGHRYGEGVYSD
ncbi:unnamed protein product [Mycena citricolor]|uniref:Uncharacterized protein n=1 Tax=Mycena citricolor TaxID=2018698 RepID=A0AAD2Q2Q6_9AGAR|nr:unnamed protein product [Mycena citricolor]